MLTPAILVLSPANSFLHMHPAVLYTPPSPPILTPTHACRQRPVHVHLHSSPQAITLVLGAVPSHLLLRPPFAGSHTEKTFTLTRSGSRMAGWTHTRNPPQTICLQAYSLPKSGPVVFLATGQFGSQSEFYTLLRLENMVYFMHF